MNDKELKNFNNNVAKIQNFISTTKLKDEKVIIEVDASHVSVSRAKISRWF